MSYSYFNELLDELHNYNDFTTSGKLYNECIQFHLPEATPLRNPPNNTKVIGNPTNLFEDRLQLGAIYFMNADSSNNGWWFVIGYSNERLEVFYGELRNDTITSEGLYLWKIMNIYNQPPNNIITDSSLIQTVMDYFGADLSELFIAYSPSLSNPRTLNFSKRGFMR
mgnify:CR=1 FL=1